MHKSQNVAEFLFDLDQKRPHEPARVVISKNQTVALLESQFHVRFVPKADMRN
jgi:hypothetical protein